MSSSPPQILLLLLLGSFRNIHAVLNQDARSPRCNASKEQVMLSQTAKNKISIDIYFSASTTQLPTEHSDMFQQTCRGSSQLCMSGEREGDKFEGVLRNHKYV